MRYEGKGESSGILGKIPECLKNIGKTSAVWVKVEEDWQENCQSSKQILKFIIDFDIEIDINRFSQASRSRECAYFFSPISTSREIRQKILKF
jgi:hypothetical protein